jgi:hypothetical protein
MLSGIKKPDRLRLLNIREILGSKEFLKNVTTILKIPWKSTMILEFFKSFSRSDRFSFDFTASAPSIEMVSPEFSNIECF